MPGYRAGPGSGFLGSYAYPDTRPRVDVGSAIDALANGASSLIHQAYQRKVVENEKADRDRRFALEQQRVGIDQARETRDAANQDREAQLRETSERHRFIEAGGIPGGESYDFTPNTTDVSSGFQPNMPTSLQTNGSATPAPMAGGVGTNQSPIARAMAAGVPSSVSPDQQPTPPQQSAPVASRRTVTAESYDPTRAGTYQRGVAVQELRNEGWDTRENIIAQNRAEVARTRAKQQMDAAQFAKDWHIQVAQINAKARTSGVNGRKPMTGNQAEQTARNAAIGLVGKFDGSVDAAQDWLKNTDEGQTFQKDTGVRPDHLMYAREQFVKGMTSAAVRLQPGPAGLNPEEAVDAVVTSRNRVISPPADTSGATAAPTATGSAPARRTTVVAPAPRSAPSRPQTPSDTGSSTASSDSLAPQANDFTDDEVRAAYRAGMRKDKEIANWIQAQRTKRGAHPNLPAPRTPAARRPAGRVSSPSPSTRPPDL